MSSPLGPRASRGLFGRGLSCRKAKCWRPQRRGDESGFTLLELIIVVAIMPIVVGGLSVALIAVFSLQSSVTNRLTDTSDAQVVSANYQKDIQSAAYITTDSTSNPQCGAGTGTQLLGLESVLNQSTGTFQTLVSYVSVPVTGGSAVTYSLERLYCTNGSTTPSSVTTLAYDLPSPTSATSPLVAPSITCAEGATESVCSSSGQQWTQGYVPAADIASVSFNVTAPASSYNYYLVASPAASTSFNSGGVASTPAATCESTSSSSSPYSGEACFVDFSGLTANDITAAEVTNSCYNMSVAIETSDILHFCLSVTSNTSGEGFVPSAVPTDTDSGFGQAVFSGLGGEPALYMNPYEKNNNTTETVTLSSIYVVNALTGLKSTDWTLISADAETVNEGEYMTWTSNNPISVLNDMEAGATAPDGNACGLTGAGTTSVTCTGKANSYLMTGAALVAVSTPSYLTLVENNYSAVAFGMLLP